MDGIEATRQLAGPDVADPIAVVVITTFDLDEYVHGALKAGARGFLLKDAGPELLVQAIHAAARRRRADRAQRHRAAAGRVRRRRTGRPPRAAASHRSPTARRTCWSRSPAASPTPRSPIELHISLSTVKTHLGEPDEQAGRTQPGRAGDVGLRDRQDRSVSISGAAELRAVPPAGLEPATCGLEVRRSVHLSYGGPTSG